MYFHIMHIIHIHTFTRKMAAYGYYTCACFMSVYLKLLETTTSLSDSVRKKDIMLLCFTFRSLAATPAHLNLLDSVHFTHLSGPLLFFPVLPPDDREDVIECSCAQDINIHHMLVWFFFQNHNRFRILSWWAGNICGSCKNLDNMLRRRKF